MRQIYKEAAAGLLRIHSNVSRHISSTLLAASMVILDGSINHGNGTIWDTMPNSDL